MSDPVALDHNPRRNYCKVVGDGRINACADVQGIGDYMTANLAWRPDVLVVVCRRCGTEVTAATTANVWREMLAPAVPALPSQPSALDELLAAARYAAEYLSPAPPTEGKPMKAGVILRAAIRRYEAQR